MKITIAMSLVLTLVSFEVFAGDDDWSQAFNGEEKVLTLVSFDDFAGYGDWSQAFKYKKRTFCLKEPKQITALGGHGYASEVKKITLEAQEHGPTNYGLNIQARQTVVDTVRILENGREFKGGKLVEAKEDSIATKFLISHIYLHYEVKFFRKQSDELFCVSILR